MPLVPDTPVRGQSPSSMGESFFFPLYQARKYVLTSWYCPRVVNPSSGLGGLEGRQKMSVILSVSQFVCLSEGCKPEFWIGRSGGAAKNVRHSVRLSVSQSVSLSVPGSLARVASSQTSVPSPFLFTPELNWWAGITCRVYGLLY